MPLAIDLFCGLGGWTEGLLAEGYDVIGFDIERHEYGEHRYPAQLVLQDVLTIHGRQFKNAQLIVASPPCQAYSYRAMPWKRAKALPPPDNSLFEACFRIQAEASAAAGRHIPLVVENVKGAQKWVGRARWHYGSFYLWGDIPALMPMTRAAFKTQGQNWARDHAAGKVSPHWSLEGIKTVGHPNQRNGHRSTSHLTNPREHLKNGGGSWFGVAHNTASGKGQNPDGRLEGVKHHGSGAVWFDTGPASLPSGSTRRKYASAMIAKIPLPLSRHIAAVYK